MIIWGFNWNGAFAAQPVDDRPAQPVDDQDNKKKWQSSQIDDDRKF